MPELRKIDCEGLAPDIPTRLEELRAANEAGELSAIAIAVVYRDGTTGCCTSTMYSRSTMLGSVELLKQEIIDKIKGRD